MLTSHLPRISLAHLPTPLEAMPRLSAALGGAELWIKRDEQTGLAGGGNKTRKLEYLCADARTQGAKTLITAGAPQSNHCRQTAGAAAKLGFNCVLVLAGHPTEVSGNIVLNKLLGANIVWAGDESMGDMLSAIFKREQTAGRKPYLIPYGGSNPIGASAYIAAMEELAAQMQAQTLPPFDRIVFASSSGGTQSGMLLGARLLGLSTQILGISVDKPEVELSEDIVAKLANETAKFLGLEGYVSGKDVAVNAGYLGGGYAVMGEAEIEAIQLFARTESILLDPVYTGRAAAGLIDLLKKEKIGKNERILFWHTGGAPALFTPKYAKQLTINN
ncbi:MAG TPA: D-cysteine desulfhydrase family protein [Chloroflexi bacterium]|nr:D-cysteine desulfhydrase family protein [Chloroflexota bacterium]